MEIRQMATAFLFNENKVLMMKKTGNRLYNFEFWSGLGGHLEPGELNYPRQACIREIDEEAGFMETDITDFSLKYILLRIKEDEIRQQFVYFGRTDRSDFVCSDEGELFWIDQKEVLHLHLSTIIKYMLEHYFQNPDLQEVTIGTITTNDEQEPRIQWAELKDPMIF